MNKIYLKILLTGLIFISLALPVDAQRSNGLTVEGTVSVEEGSVDGAIIQMFRDGRRLDNYGIGTNGRYRVELNYNHEWTLIFARPGNFPQKIVVDTKVPRAVLQSDPLFPPFPVDVKLFTEISGIDRTFSENTVLKIYYADRVDNFISDMYYNDAQIKNLIDQAILQSQKINREADYLAGLTRAELAELRKEYDQLIKEAENEYKKEEFLNALDGYQAASKIFPKEQYPKDRIAEINDLLGLLMVAEEMQHALAERLEALIKQADALYDAQKYQEARNAYHRALSVDPNHKHALQRSEEIAAIIRQQQVGQEYQNLIVKADNSFKELLYVEARNAYQQASQLKENELYPKQRIQEIDNILNQQAQNAERLKSYDEAVFQAELNFEKQFYERAISFYESALTHRPGDEVAVKRIQEIKELMNELANRTTYDRLIKSADRSFQRKQYNEALAEYEHAAELLPKEDYPQNQISRINEIFAEEARLLAEAEAAEQARLAAEQAQIEAEAKAREERYRETVDEADRLAENDELVASVGKFREALDIKPQEQYPITRIEEIRGMIARQQEFQQAYDAAIARADREFGNESFELAKVAYTEAQQAKPDELYSVEQIAKIDSIVETRARLAAEAEAEAARLAAEAEAAEQARLAAIQAEQNRQYAQAVSRGDSLFNLNEYEPSRTAYQSALHVKSDETYPQQRINEIGQILAQLLSAQQAYDAAIARADREFGNESFDLAKLAYTEAQQAKPDELYPAEQITKIDSIVETRARLAAEAEAEAARLAAEAEAAEQARLAAIQAEQNRQYAQAVSRGDSLFNLNEYEPSRTAYQSALQVKPEEAYPQQRINEIGQILAQLLSAQQAYDAAIARADREFGNESFDLAKLAYTEAQQAKPDELYPAEQIAKIDSIVETRARLAAEAEAEAARLAAEAEAEEQARLAAIQAEQNRQYAQAVSRGDSLFNLNEYEPSRTAYQSALQVKPDERYPQQRIDEIGQILAQLLSAQQAYDAAIARADREFGNESFELAKVAYTEAQQAKPDESYPAEQIAKIDSIVETRAQLAAEAEAEAARLAAEAEAAEQARQAAIQAEQNRQYAKAVSRGDSLFNRNEYEPSRTAYQSALEVKPEEAYPQQRINEINGIFQERELLNREYQNAIAVADQQFNARDYSNSRNSYEKALEIKPEQTYPKEKITEVDRILAQQELDESYRIIILAADGFFNSESWNDAKSEYQKASEIKPNESYPKSQIVKIENLLRQQQERALAEQRAAENMERRRAEIEQRQQQMSERRDISEAELNQLYNEYILLADGFFDNQRYNVSRSWYFKAWDVKPEETYPPQRIEEINRIVKSLLLNQRDRDYQNFVNLADSTFRQNQLAVARGWYNRALTVKPQEIYPKEQLQAITDLIAERMTSRSGEQFNSHMQNATEAFENGNYNVARFWYKKALELRPDDSEAKEGLSKITDTLK